MRSQPSSPGQQGEPSSPAEARLTSGVDRLAVLERDQHVVHQRHGRVGGTSVAAVAARRQRNRLSSCQRGWAKRHRRNNVHVDGASVASRVQIGHSSSPGGSGDLHLGQISSVDRNTGWPLTTLSRCKSNSLITRSAAEVPGQGVAPVG